MLEWKCLYLSRKRDTIMENLIDLTENQIGAMTECEAQDVLDRILDIQGKILSIEGKIRARLFAIGERKCKSCGATAGYLRFRTDGTYFCQKCGYSTGGPK